MSYEQRIIKLIESDPVRMRALRAARSLDLPDWLIAAGFVRNLVWSNVFEGVFESVFESVSETKFQGEAALNDIDVIYFCISNTSEERDKDLEGRLRELEPGLPWSVKNQARMHLKNGDAPYQNTLDAMGHWPEKQTSIGVMLDSNDSVSLQHCFELSLQFRGTINHNPARSVEVFNKRVSEKGWLKIWPGLQVAT